jgi:hypothetical protein
LLLTRQSDHLTAFVGQESQNPHNGTRGRFTLSLPPMLRF